MEQVGSVLARQLGELHRDTADQQKRNRAGYAAFVASCRPATRAQVDDLRVQAAGGPPDDDVWSREATSQQWEPPQMPPITGIEANLVRNIHPIRPGVMACQTIPEGTTYCGGEWHHRYRMGKTNLFYWSAYARCPVAQAEGELRSKAGAVVEAERKRTSTVRAKGKARDQE